MEQHRFEILKTELILTQQEVDKYDQMSTTIKTWAVTLWVASSGWALQSKNKEVFLLSAVIMVVFWFFDGINKTFRMNYRKRREEVSKMLEKVFLNKALNENDIAPKLPIHDLKDAFRHMSTLHLVVPYIALAAISLIIFFAS
ncbi:MAG: hypothetical protein UY23_C0002G0013 [Candidatus Jorgensenbacteria bacterium GW2011_GWA1_48_11]|uniref:Uncharacterized protein n=1 Tax=Candidatus Jorgensenbacteria bacterium GW2011_GWA1_48_11 TaxID=1618660 RepID=A0A0G1UAX6_9BACT|nr:MAG: hypothetical protein UY23_C0002G0013 [Candidatus Jorgensenbacteria bacterium GW2011_GWA1_48_11]KKW12712.1 MAG: hypothetical protein UY51_C0001G0012 [Candidatus Jorgensenbacteria bacterium GW2011_GWB1_49_9]